MHEKSSGDSMASPILTPEQIRYRKIPFGSPQDFLALLQQHGAADLLGVNEDTLFLAESTFIQDWNETFGRVPEMRGLDALEVLIDDLKNAVQIYIAYHNGGSGCDEIYIDYEIRYATGTNFSYSVSIIYNESLVYYRDAGQDERTEWKLNYMANDIVDEDGNLIFEGDIGNF